MAHNRIYFLNTDGHISDPPEEVECVDDQVAIETAIPLLNGRAIEVWEGPHLMTSRTRSQRNANCSCLVQTGPLPKQVVDRRAPGAMGGRVGRWEEIMRISIVLVFALLPLWASLARAQQQPAQSTGIFGALTPAVAAVRHSRHLSRARFAAVRHRASVRRLGGRTDMARGATASMSGSTTSRKPPPSSPVASDTGSTIRRRSGFRSISTARSCSACPASPCIA